MEKVLMALNEIVAEGVISSYAIGGAIGASFYIESVNTTDVDAFVFMTPELGGLLSLSPIYETLKAKGGIVSGEHIVIGEWPIQILPAYKPLVEKALEHAIDTTYKGIPTKVFSPEYTCAIALDTGRAKDYARVFSFIEQDQVQISKLWKLVGIYNLKDKLINNVVNWPGVPDENIP